MKIKLFLRAQRENFTLMTRALASKEIENERNKIDVKMKKK